MFRTNGGLLGAQRSTDATSGIGVWSLVEQVTRKRINAWPRTDDPLGSNVILLLHGSGSNGSQTITDSSASPKTVTAVGDAQITTAQSKFDGSSITFDGTGDYLSCTLPALGTEDFTIESWIRVGSFVNYRVLYETRSSDADSAGFVWGIDASARLYIFTGGSFRLTAGTLSVNTWHHVALTRASGAWRMFIDGVLLSGSYSNSANLTRTATRLGMDWASLFPYLGQIDEYRITTAARYTSTFTPPTAAFPNP